MTYNYRPNGVCARGISFDIEDGTVKNIKFSGGCSGNTQGVASLADGMDAN
ncbi:MAG: TSCPD domain-containing protein, partial [Clostridia bacterium]|nr:TSCPD domain-containing protein [Clostridia bacterium]